MATDLERLVVSLDADIRQLTNKLNKAGVAVEGFAKKADRDTAAAARKISDNLSKTTTGGHGSGGASTPGGLSYVQKQEFTHIGKSIADEIAAGQSPLRAIQVEGGRIVQAFSSGPGGVGGTFKALGTTLGGLVSPAALAAAGVLGIGGAAIYAAVSFEETERAIKAGLLGIGAASGATVNDIRRIGAELAASHGISVSAGEDIATTLAKTGHIDVGSIGDVGKLTRGFANLTGQGLGESAKALGNIFADPAKGAQTLQGLLGGLDAKTRDYITTLQAQGHQQEALKALLAAATPDLTKAADATGAWAGAWQKVEDAAAGASRAIGGALAHTLNPTPEDHVTDLRRQAAAAQTAGKDAGLFAFGGQFFDENKTDPSEVRRLRSEIDDAESRIQDAKNAAAKDTEHKQLTEKTDPVAADLATANPLTQQIKTLAAEIQRGRDILATPGALALLPNDGRDLKATLDGLDQRLTGLKAAAEQGGQALHDAAKDAEFRTATAGLDGYALAARTAQHEVEGLRQALIATGDASKIAAGEALLPKIEASKIAAAQKMVLEGDSKYAHGVSDAPDKYQPAIFSAAAKYNLSPDFIASILMQESHFNPNASSPAGAQGLAQFMSGTAKQYGVDVTDPTSSIMGAAHYLSDLKKQFGDEKAAAAAYNAGPGNYQAFLDGKRPLRQETMDYVPAIFDKRSDFDKRSQFDKAGTEQIVEARRRLAEAESGVSKAADASRLSDMALQQMRAAGLPIDDAARARAAAQAAELVKLAEATKAAAAAASIRQQRVDLGLSRDESAVQGQVRGAGLDPASGAGADMAQQLREIATAGEVKSEATSSIQDLTHALIEGRSAGEAFHNVLQRLGEKIADKGIDSLVSSVFGGVSGGTGGGFGSALSSLFGGRFAEGGVIGGAGGHIANGIIRGMGGPTADKVPAWVSPAEFEPNPGRIGAGLAALAAVRLVRRFAA